MNFTVKKLLPADLSNETAFQLVQFTRRLAFALESIYFDQLLIHTSECEHDPFSRTNQDDDENGNPF
jgi:hypothetical protein